MLCQLDFFIVLCFDYWNNFLKEIKKYPEVCNCVLHNPLYYIDEINADFAYVKKYIVCTTYSLIFFSKDTYLHTLKDKHVGIFIDNTFTSAQSCDLSSLKKTIIVRKLFLLDCFVSNFKMLPST